jgi:hypothetical protein
MTASADPNFFERLLASVKNTGNLKDSAGIFGDALNMRISNAPGQFVVAPGSGGMQNAAQQAGRFVGAAARGLSNPLMAAGINAFDPLMKGDYAGAAGAAGGAAGGGMLANAINAMPINPLFKVAASVALPVLGGNIGKGVSTGVANTVSGPMAAAQTANTTRVVNALDPNSPVNVSDMTSEAMLKNLKEIQEVFGKDRTAAMLHQRQILADAEAMDRRKAILNMQLSPVAAMRDQAKLAQQGSIQLADTALSSMGNAINTAIASNPYAAMLLPTV